MANPTFVQGAVNSDGTNTGDTTLAQAFTSNNTLGNTIVVIAIWGDTGENVTGVSDSPGGGASNTYVQKYYATGFGALTVAVYVATNIKAGANTVTMTWGAGGADFPDLWIVETTPAAFDAANGNNGTTGGTAQGMTVSVSPTGSNDLMIATGYVDHTINAFEAGYTQRVPSTGQDNNGNALATKAGVASGAQTVTMSQSASGGWFALAVAVKALPGAEPNSIFYGSE
jgi:hypothetical protein